MDDAQQVWEEFDIPLLYLKRRDDFRKEISAIMEAHVRRIAECRELIASVDEQLGRSASN